MIKRDRYKYILTIAMLMLVHVSIMFFWISNMKNKVSIIASSSRPSLKIENKSTPANLPKTLLANN